MTAHTAHYLGEGGTVIEMDLPLPEVMADKVTRGYLRRVNPDGSPYVEPAEDTAADPSGDGGEQAPPRPARSARKPEWVGYAVRVGGMSPDEAEALTVQDLIERFGQEV